MGRHMNNAAYVRMFASRFSVAEREAWPVREMEIHYRYACYEGQRLLLRKREGDGGALEFMAAPAGEEKPAVLARLLFA